MTVRVNRQVLLASRPRGWPEEGNFRLVESPVPVPGDNQLLLRAHWLSLDPYMRGRMNEGRSYVKPVDVGAVMCGECISEVVESRHPEFAVGDWVHGDLGWQEYAISDGSGLRKLDPRVPLTAQLGLLGMPGLTAYFGLLDIGQPKAGETVVVSAAAGAVGGVVGQLAKIHGARAVGIAGGAAKCRYVVDELGFDACLDYKAGDLAGQLKAAAPDGVDVYFDNVGGEITDTVLGRMNPFSRMPRPAARPRNGVRGPRVGAARLPRPAARREHGQAAGQAALSGAVIIRTLGFTLEQVTWKDSVS
jgi:NADPH-dependent curcumin reductase CurA